MNLVVHVCLYNINNNPYNRTYTTNCLYMRDLILLKYQILILLNPPQLMLPFSPQITTQLLRRRRGIDLPVTTWLVSCSFEEVCLVYIAFVFHCCTLCFLVIFNNKHSDNNILKILLRTMKFTIFTIFNYHIM